MKISAVSNVNAFKGAQEVSATTSPNDKKDIKEIIKDNKDKIAIGLGALAAAGVAAVAISRGKKVSPELKINGFKEIPSELSIDDFKKIGKFDKGMATVNGKPFSGVVCVTNKENKYAIEYIDGVLKTSTLGAGNKPYIRKVYEEKDGVKIIEDFMYVELPKFEEKGKKIGFEGWTPGRHKTIITDNKIVNEHKSLSETLREITEKQQDGTWKKTFQSIVSDADGKYVLTKDAAGNVIERELIG